MFVTEKPIIFEVGYKTYLIDCFGMGCAMVYVGEKAALLVDTGCGNYDLKGMLEKFIPVPIHCAVTHEHGDHIGGIAQFDKVYVPALELETIANTDGVFVQKFCDYFRSVVEQDDGLAGVFKIRKEVVSWEKKPELIPLYDGDRFDLGGRKVTCYRCQVHSKGHMVYVDELTKGMFGGDSVSCNTGPASNPMNPPTIVSLEDEIRGLENIKKHENEYTHIWSGHAEWGGHLSQIKSMPKEVVDGMLEVGKKAINGELEILEETGSHGTRNYAEYNGIRLYFFGSYMKDTDLPEEYQYEDPGKTPRKEAICLY